MEGRKKERKKKDNTEKWNRAEERDSERTNERSKRDRKKVIRMAYLTDLIRDFKIPARVYNVVVKL